MTHIQVINGCICSYSNNKMHSINVLMQMWVSKVITSHDEQQFHLNQCFSTGASQPQKSSAAPSNKYSIILGIYKSIKRH